MRGAPQDGLEQERDGPTLVPMRPLVARREWMGVRSRARGQVAAMVQVSEEGNSTGWGPCRWAEEAGSKESLWMSINTSFLKTYA